MGLNIEAATIPDAMLKVDTVQAITGLSRSSIYRAMEKDFPKPIKSGRRCTRWRAGDVMAWLRARVEPEKR